MAFSAERLLAHAFPELNQRYEARDAILYALGIGLGAEPCDPLDLGYLYENGLAVLPTFAATLASPGMWVRDPALEIAWVKLVHARQSAEFLAPLPPEGAVVSRPRIASVVDLGAERGAEVVVERTVADAASAVPYCRLRQTILMRGNGGFAAHPAARPARWSAPARAPDARVPFQTSPRAALIYRLSGDRNPLHIDPAVAAKAGFARPILHGLASYGLCAWVVLKTFAGGDPARLAALAVRFAGPVMPGERIDFALWQDGDTIAFEAHVAGRLVLDGGEARLRPGAAQSLD